MLVAAVFDPSGEENAMDVVREQLAPILAERGKGSGIKVRENYDYSPNHQQSPTSQALRILLATSRPDPLL